MSAGVGERILARREPVLGVLTRHIAEDEVRHYKHFYRYFRKYQDRETPSRSAVVPALWRRLRMTGGDDSYIVLKHVYSTRHPGEPFDLEAYRRVRRECRALLHAHFPHRRWDRVGLGWEKPSRYYKAGLCAPGQNRSKQELGIQKALGD